MTAVSPAARSVRRQVWADVVVSVVVPVAVLLTAAGLFLVLGKVAHSAAVIDRNTGPRAPAVCSLRRSSAVNAREQSLVVDDALLARFHQAPIDPTALPPIGACP